MLIKHALVSLALVATAMAVEQVSPIKMNPMEGDEPEIEAAWRETVTNLMLKSTFEKKLVIKDDKADPWKGKVQEEGGEDLRGKTSIAGMLLQAQVHGHHCFWVREDLALSRKDIKIDIHRQTVEQSVTTYENPEKITYRTSYAHSKAKTDSWRQDEGWSDMATVGGKVGGSAKLGLFGTEVTASTEISASYQWGDSGSTGKGGSETDRTEDRNEATRTFTCGAHKICEIQLWTFTASINKSVPRVPVIDTDCYIKSPLPSQDTTKTKPLIDFIKEVGVSGKNVSLPVVHGLYQPLTDLGSSFYTLGAQEKANSTKKDEEANNSKKDEENNSKKDETNHSPKNETNNENKPSPITKIKPKTTPKMNPRAVSDEKPKEKAKPKVTLQNGVYMLAAENGQEQPEWLQYEPRKITSNVYGQNGKMYDVILGVRKSIKKSKGTAAADNNSKMTGSSRDQEPEPAAGIKRSMRIRRQAQDSEEPQDEDAIKAASEDKDSETEYVVLRAPFGFNQQSNPTSESGQSTQSAS